MYYIGTVGDFLLALFVVWYSYYWWYAKGTICGFVLVLLVNLLLVVSYIGGLVMVVLVVS